MSSQIPSKSPKQGMAIGGLVCGILAFLIFPVVLGPVGIVLGGLSWKAGNKLGSIATIVAIVGTVVGMLIGAAVWTSS